MTTSQNLTPTAGGDITLLEEASIRSTMDDSLSKATQLAYGKSLKNFYAFCTSRGWEDTADPERFAVWVLAWLQARADAKCSRSTLTKDLSAVKWSVAYNSPLSAALFTKPVKDFMAGLGKAKKHDVIHKAAALDLDTLEAMYRAFPTEPAGRRNRALVAVGIAAALRSSSLAALNLGDVSKAATIDGLSLAIRFSKTDQLGEGRTIPIARAKTMVLDPVGALEKWLAVMKTFGFTPQNTPNVPLFPRVTPREVTQERISRPDILITKILRDSLYGLGMPDFKAYTSHTLRATFVTLCYDAGVSEKTMTDITGHKDTRTLRGYDRSRLEQSAQTDYLDRKTSK